MEYKAYILIESESEAEAEEKFFNMDREILNESVLIEDNKETEIKQT